MKKILFGITALLISGATFSQTIQASIGAGDIPSKVRIFVKCSAPVASSNISTLQFNLGIAASVTPRPTIVVYPNTTNFPGVSWQISTAEEGGYFHYALTTPTAPVITTALNTTSEVAVADVEFFGGPAGVQNVSLVSLPQGGASGNQLFLSTGTPASVSNGHYFSRTGVVATNGDSYEGSFTSTAVISNISLPVKFLSFFAVKNGDDAKLNWTVESDQNNRFFDVERSTDGRVFSSMTKVDAKGNGKSINTYEAVDNSLSRLGAGNVYYRIKQVDFNGEITYSNIKNLSSARKGVPAQIFPNPARNITKLVLDVDAPGKGSILVRDMGGKLVQQMNTMFVKGINQQEINVEQLPSGEYSVLVIGDGFSYPLKFTKMQ